MNKSYIIKEVYSGMRIDRWIRNNIASLPQSLIERSLRKGKIKVNIKKVNSSYKLKTGDKIKFFNFTFEVNKHKVLNKKFSPSSELLKVHENRILENNDDFIVGDGLVRRKSIIADNTSSKIDSEIIAISKISLNNSMNIIKKNRFLLEKLVDLLINLETIDNNVFKEISFDLLKV